VIFGVTGDLTKRLLMPALYNLARWGLLPEDFGILGIGRGDMSADTLRDRLTADMQDFVRDKAGASAADPLDENAWRRVVGRLDYLRGDATGPDLHADIARRLGGEPDGAAAEEPRRSALFYLAVGADLFGPIVSALGQAGSAREAEGTWRRVIVEKPFGHDLASARDLNATLLSVLQEHQVFRMDHFLGKETVQNIMAFRFGNGLFEPLWNRDRIDHVQISVAETVGVEKRGSLYDRTGALRDMVPNHVFQLFTMIAMEPPVSFAADAVRDRREEVLASVHPLDAETALRDAVRAQYAAGTVGGRPVRDYRAEPDVDPGSTTETYVALRLSIDNWRWAGVPFYLRTGKSMTVRDTEIAIRFKPAPLALFRETPVDEAIPNWLVMQIQPDEGIFLQIGAKVPGPEVRLDPVTMGFRYRDYFKPDPITGYETLIYDAMTGDATLFQRADNIEGGWRVVQPLLDAWAAAAGGGAPLARYAAGTAGPAEADDLLAREGRAWRTLG
jgi:glucose-6-phosphate 1-dehydrogenase